MFGIDYNEQISGYKFPDTLVPYKLSFIHWIWLLPCGPFAFKQI